MLRISVLIDAGSAVYPAVHHVDGAVAHRSQAFIVCDNDERLPELFPQTEEQSVEFFPVVRVEASGRFIGQDDGRFVGQCACHGNPLLLSSRKFVGLVAGSSGQSHEAQQFFGSLAGGLHGLSGNQHRNHDVFHGREFRQQLVELENEPNVLVPEPSQFFFFQLADIRAIETDFPAVRPVECADDLQQSCLACAAGAGNACYFSFPYFQVNAFQYLEVAEAFGDIF